MRNVIGICNLHDDPSLGLLTASRPLGAVTFLGRYGLIDFTLSNFANSGIDKMYVLVKKGILQMKNHIGSGSIWNTNTIRGMITLLINEEGLLNPKFNTDVANVRTNMNLRKMDFDYVVLAPSFMLASIDYNPFIEQHVNSGKDISVIYAPVKNVEHEYDNCDVLKMNKNGEVFSISKNTGRLKDANISLESFIISKNALIKLVNDELDISEFYSFRQVITHEVNNGLISLNGLRFDGYFAPILDIEHYISYSFKMLDKKESSKLFLQDWPIYTTPHGTPPALYGKKAEVSNCFIANGSMINGKVKNSIISRDVTIEEGAEVSNCIIFTGSYIGKDVKMKYVLTDKEVKVVENKNNCGSSDRFLYLKHGAKI